MTRVLKCVPLILFATALSVNAAPKNWLPCTVLERGHVTYGGVQIQTATVEVLDSGNSNPLARRAVYIITVEPWRTFHPKVLLDVGDQLSVIPYGQPAINLGPKIDFMQIRYEEKGKEKSEWHQIAKQF